VGLIQSVFEKAGIPTVSITVCRELTEKVGPPRAVFVDRPFGYTMGEPGNAALQTAILRTALSLLTRPVDAPLIVDF
jgi:D-proline reductase (dithiol) PrdB